MSHTKDDTGDAVYRELVNAFGEDWSIDDFRPDSDLAVDLVMSGGEEPGDLIVTQTVQLRLPLTIAQRLQHRAEDADASVDELVSEWVTAEAAADNSISRDEILALLARRHPRSA
jgi:hypothetical protein